MIKISHVRKTFGKQVVLDDVSFEIEEGKTSAIVGPSGTGKSVLLKLITGLLPADSGEILVGKKSMTAARTVKERQAICSDMGVLFQGAALFDSLTLFDNVAFPLRARKSHKEKEIIELAVQGLEEVGLLDHANSLPGEVSIGMRKRVGIARALITEPTYLLFDEPNTGLDPETGQEIYELIRETQEHFGFTGIVISHEIPEVFQVCERVTMLHKGRVQFDGAIDEFLASDKPVVRQFVNGDIEGPIRMN